MSWSGTSRHESLIFGGASACQTQIFLKKRRNKSGSRGSSPLREIIGLARVGVVEAGGVIGGVGVVELQEAVGMRPHAMRMIGR